MKRWKELERSVERALSVYGCKFHRVDNYRCFKCGQVQNSKAKGFPDFFVYSPFILAVEVKTGKAVLTLDQKETKEDMEKSGINYLVIRETIDELLSYLDKQCQTSKNI